MLRELLLRLAAIEMSLRNTMARVEVVPWSMARTKGHGGFLGVSLRGGYCVIRLAD